MLDLNANEGAAMKQLCEIYSKRGEIEKGTKYMEMMVDISKKGDQKKYR